MQSEMNTVFDLTVFTPTYNRAHTLPQLYKSILAQNTNLSFEWLIVDDGSTDNTSELIQKWIEQDKISIHYHRKINEGKPIAINTAVRIARSPWLFIVDSDDYLTDDALNFISSHLQEISNDNSFVGIGGLRQSTDIIAHIQFSDYVDATNLEREQFGLNIDCNEVYRIDILKRHPFATWPGEKFAPEAITLNEIALQGYKLRWYNKYLVVSQYMPDGYTKNSWALIKNNPMGYAMLYNHQLKYCKKISKKLYLVIQMDAQCILGKELSYALKSNSPILAALCMPLGLIVSIRRFIQFQKLKGK